MPLGFQDSRNSRIEIAVRPLSTAVAKKGDGPQAHPLFSAAKSEPAAFFQSRKTSHARGVLGSPAPSAKVEFLEELLSGSMIAAPRSRCSQVVYSPRKVRLPRDHQGHVEDETALAEGFAVAAQFLHHDAMGLERLQGAQALLGGADLAIHVKDVFPGPAMHRPGFDLGQVGADGREL